MVKTETTRKYICEVCGRTGPNKKSMEKHERYPIHGLDLKLGQLFRFDPFSNNQYFGVVVVEYQKYDSTHEHQFSGDCYRIPLHGELMTPYNREIVEIRKSRITELTQEEYDRAKDRIKDSLMPTIRKVISKGIIQEHQ
jgi:hypothetical protein